MNDCETEVAVSSRMQDQDGVERFGAKSRTEQGTGDGCESTKCGMFAPDWTVKREKFRLKWGHTDNSSRNAEHFLNGWL